MARDAQRQLGTGVERTKTRQSQFRQAAAALALCLLPSSLMAQAPARITELESKIWTGDLSNFAQLEGEAVRQIQLNPSGAYEHYLVAELMLRMFRQNPSELRFLKNASELSQQAIELAPESEVGYLVAAQVMDLMGYRQDAVNMLLPKTGFEQGWRSSLVKGILASAQSADAASLKEFDQTLNFAEAPRELVGSFVAASLESLYGGQELADNLEMWRKKGDAQALRLSLARTLEELDKPEEAHKIYAALEAEGRTDVAFADGILLYTKLKRPDVARKRFAKIVLSDGNVELRSAAAAHLARLDLKVKNYKAAAAGFSQVLKQSDNRFRWLSFAHKAYGEEKALSEFASWMDDIKDDVQGTGYFYALRGEVLSESLARHEKAVDSFNAAIALDPLRSEFYNGKGLAFYRMNEHEKALSVFHQALAVDPKDATARYNEACVLALMGRKEEALGSLRQAISLDGRLQSVALQDKDFESLRGRSDFQALVEKARITTAH